MKKIEIVIVNVEIIYAYDYLHSIYNKKPKLKRFFDC